MAAQLQTDAPKVTWYEPHSSVVLMDPSALLPSHRLVLLLYRLSVPLLV